MGDTEQKQHTRRWHSIVRKRAVRRALVPAAIFAVVFCLSFTTEGSSLKNMYNAVATWTDNVFSFRNTSSIVSDDQLSANPAPTILIQHTLRECGMNPDIAPTWLPEEFKLRSIYTDDCNGLSSVVALYMYEDRTVSINLHKNLNGATTWYEKDNRIVECYTSNDVLYYIFHNESSLVAAWVNDPYECNITGNLSIEEMKCIIDSIPKG